jgi:hypothetical protein
MSSSSPSSIKLLKFLVLVCYCGHLLTSCNAHANVSLSYTSESRDGSKVQLNMIRILNQQSVQSDIRLVGKLSLDEALFGCQMMMEYNRQMIDPSCQLTVCPACRGMGYIVKKRRSADALIKRNIIYPCYYCHQTGSTVHIQGNCHGLITFPVAAEIEVPPNSKTGDVITIPHLGNQVIDNNRILNGNLVLTIDKVASGDIEMQAGYFELTVRLTPLQALNGFVYNKTFTVGGAENRILIDRQNKTTTMSQTVTVKGVKMCCTPTPLKPTEIPSSVVTDMVATDARSCAIREDWHLLVKFALLSEKETDELEDIPVNVDDDGNMIFTSQDDLNLFMRKYESKRESQRARGLLKLLEKLQK